MDHKSSAKKVSTSPTIPIKKDNKKKFDITDLLEEGPLPLKETEGKELGLDEKLRKAYFWITNYAIINPFYDIEYSDTSPIKFTIGDLKTKINLPSSQSYSSF